MATYRYMSTKTYGHDLGLSCCFRQWRAASHCAQLHGYALSFKFTFGTNELDSRNWVVDFGGLKPLKAALVKNFDHTLVIAKDDPMMTLFGFLNTEKCARVVVMDEVGCEAFARFGYELAQKIVDQSFPHVVVLSCEVSEHGANSAIYNRDDHYA